jgi:hypothetical protein
LLFDYIIAWLIVMMASVVKWCAAANHSLMSPAAVEGLRGTLNNCGRQQQQRQQEQE